MMIVPVNRLTTKTMMPRKIIVKVLLLRRLPPSLTEHLMVPHKQHYIIPLLLPGKVSCSAMRSEPPLLVIPDCCRAWMSLCSFQAGK